MQNYQEHASRLLNPDGLKSTGGLLPTSGKGRDVQLRLASDVKERIELVHTSQYSPFLQSFFPVFERLIISQEYAVPPEMINGPNHKVRNVVLEILHRLPNNDVLKPYVQRLMSLSMVVLQNDNEENALIALKIICDLHRNYRPLLDSKVQPLIDFVKTAYERLERCISTAFVYNKQQQYNGNANQGTSNNPSISTTGSGHSAGTGPATGEAIPQSLSSFKIVAECPVTVMLLFQLHSSFIQRNIGQLIVTMDRALALRVPGQPTNSYQMKNSAQQTAIQRHPRYADFIGCLVKTLSFLTYLLRTPPYVGLMKQYEENITANVVSLLTECPAQAILTRKELLVATRHILATEFRSGFFKHIDVLLDERVLLGPIANSTTQASDNPRAVGLQATIPPRESSVLPLAYSTLANLVHHFRGELTIPQISRIIYLFSRVVHDPSLPLSIQTTAVRLLLNLVDNIHLNNDPVRTNGKSLLLRVFDTLIRKLGTIRSRIPKVLEIERIKAKEAEMEVAQSHGTPMAWYYYAPPQNVSIPRTTSEKSTPQGAASGQSSKSATEESGSEKQPGTTDANVVDKSKQEATDGTAKSGQSLGGQGSSSGTTAVSTTNSTEQQETTDEAATAKIAKTNTDIAAETTDVQVKESANEASTESQEGDNKAQDKTDEKASQVEVIKVTVAPRGHVSAFQGVDTGVSPDHREAFHNVHRTSLNTQEREAVRAQVLGIGNSSLLANHGNSTSSSKTTDTLADLKVLLKIMIIGLKTVVWCVTNYDAQSMRQQAATPAGMRPSNNLNTTMEEDALLMRLVRWGMQCLPVFRPGLLPKCTATDATLNTPGGDQSEREKSLNEERQVLEQFAGIFTVLKPNVFSDLMEANVEFLYANMLEHRILVVLATTLLKSSSVGKSFAGVLFRFLVHRLHLLSGVHGPASLTLEKYAVARDADMLPRASCDNKTQSSATITLLPGCAAGELDTQANTAVSFDGVPQPGPLAAQSLIGLGVINRENRNELSNVPERTRNPQVQAALIGQLMETLLKSTAVFAKKTPNPGMVALFKTYFEHLVVSCLNRAAEMTSSSQAYWANYDTPAGKSNPAHADLAKEQLHGKDPYLLLLRTVFRAVTVSKVLQETVQRELDALLLPIFRALLRMLNQAVDTDALGRDNRGRAHLITEIVLLVTLRVPKQILVDFLPLFREPIVVALLAEDHGNSDLASFALKTLDTWIEVAPVALILKGLTTAKVSETSNLPPLKQALCRLLRPEPSPHGAFALKLLGKLGSPARNPMDGLTQGASIARFESKVLTVDEDESSLHDTGLAVEMTWNVGQHGKHSSSSAKELKLKWDNIVQHVVYYLQDIHVPSAKVLPKSAYALNTAGFVDSAPSGTIGSNKRQVNRRLSTHGSASGTQSTNVSRLGVASGVQQPSTDSATQSNTLSGSAGATSDHNSMEESWDDCDTDKSLPHYKSQAVKLLLACASQLMSSSTAEGGAQDVPIGAEAVSRETSYEFLLTVGAITPEQVTSLTNDQDTSSGAAGACPLPVATNNQKGSKVFAQVLRGLFTAASDVDVQREAAVKLHAVVRHIALVALSSTVHCATTVTIDTLEPVESFGTNSGGMVMLGEPIRQRCWSIDSGSVSQPDGTGGPSTTDRSHGGSSLQETFPTAGTPPKFKQTVHTTVLNNVICKFLASSRSHDTCVALEVLDTVISTFLSYYQSDSTKMAVYCQPFFNDLREKLEQLCFHSGWWARFGGCLGLNTLICRMPAKWIRAHWQSQLSALVFVIESHAIELGYAVLQSASNTLDNLINRCMPLSKRGSESAQKFVTSHIRYTTETLLNALLASFAPSRVVIRCALRSIAEHMHMDCSELLTRGGVGEYFCKSLFAIPLRMRSPDGQLAVLEALGFMLRLDPCPVKFFPHVLSKEDVTSTEKQPTVRTSQIPPTKETTSSAQPGTLQSQTVSASDTDTIKGTAASNTKPNNVVPTAGSNAPKPGNLSGQTPATTPPVTATKSDSTVAGSLSQNQSSLSTVTSVSKVSGPSAVNAGSVPRAPQVATNVTPQSSATNSVVQNTTVVPKPQALNTGVPIANKPMNTTTAPGTGPQASNPVTPSNASKSPKPIPTASAGNASSSATDSTPTGDELEGLERNLVKLLAEALLLTEAMNPDLGFSSPGAHASIASGDVHPGSFLLSSGASQRASQAARTLFSGLSVKGGKRGATFPFQHVPYPVALRKRCAEVSLDLIKHGGPQLMIYFSTQPTWMQLHHRMLALFFISLTSPWRSIAIVGDEAMPLVKEYALIPVPSNEDRGGNTSSVGQISTTTNTNKSLPTTVAGQTGVSQAQSRTTVTPISNPSVTNVAAATQANNIANRTNVAQPNSSMVRSNVTQPSNMNRSNNVAQPNTSTANRTNITQPNNNRTNNFTQLNNNSNRPNVTQSNNYNRGTVGQNTTTPSNITNRSNVTQLGNNNRPSTNTNRTVNNPVGMEVKPKQQHIISAEALSKCLHPVIQKIGEARYMSLSFLRSLPILLSLFSDYFSDEKLWSRLLQYLNQWLDPDKILKLTCTQVAQDRKVNDSLIVPTGNIARQYRPTWQSGEEVMIAASIMQVLHMGPKEIIEPCVDQLIRTTIRLEDCFPKYQHRTSFSSPGGTTPVSQGSHMDGNDQWIPFLLQQAGNVYGRISSPLRRPLLRLLNRYPLRTLNFFLSENRIGHSQYVQLFCELLNAKEAVALRRHFMTEAVSAEFIRTAFLPASDAERQQGSTHSRQPALNHVQRLEHQAQGVRIVRIMAHWCPEWLLRNKLVESLLAIWSSKTRQYQLAMEEHLTTHYRLVSKRLCEILIAYFEYAQGYDQHLHQCVHVVYAMLSILIYRTDTDYSFLYHFYAHTLAQRSPLAVRRLAVSYYAKKFQTNYNPQTKEACLRIIVLPILSHAFRDPLIATADIIPDAVVKVIVEEMLKNGVVHGATSSSVAEALQVQLLQLTTLLICHCGRELMAFRKDLVKFSGNHLKSEDSISKQWAYISICTFFDVYATPPEIILQVYVALLRSHQTSARDLVRKALDILTPALPRRLDQNKYVKAIKWTKKLVFDEGHHNAQLLHIWQLVVRHPQLFYQYRNLVVPQIVNSLNRLGLQHSCPLENRKVVVDLVELVLSWEQTRYVEAERATGSQAASSKPEESSYSQVKGTLKRRVVVSDLGIPSSILGTHKRQTKTPKVTTGDVVENTNKVSVVSQDQNAVEKSDPFAVAAQMAATDATRGFRANSTMISMIAHFLLRVRLALAEVREPLAVVLTKRSKGLFAQCLEHGQRLCEEQQYAVEKARKAQAAAGSSSTSQSANNSDRQSSNSAEQHKVRVKFGYIAKYIGLLDQKQRARAQQREHVAKARLEGGSGPPTVDGELGKPLKVELPGSMSCCFEIMISLLQSDPDTVAMPFIQDNGPDLFICIDPMFRSKERGVKRLFGQFVRQLTKLCPIDAKPTAQNQGLVGSKRFTLPTAEKASTKTSSDEKTKSKSDEAKAGSTNADGKDSASTTTTSEQTVTKDTVELPKILGVSTGVHWKPFYPTLLENIQKKLNFFADGLKGFEVIDAARLAAEKENASALAAAAATAGSSGSKTGNSASTTPKNQSTTGNNDGTKKGTKKTKGKSNKSKKNDGTTTKTKGKRKSQAGGTTKAAAAKSLAQSKAAVKARFEREADRLGAGPSGTLGTLHLVYQICGGTNETMNLAPTADVSLGKPSIVDMLSDTLMKVANRLSKDILAEVATRARTASSRNSGQADGRSTRGAEAHETNSLDQRDLLGIPSPGQTKKDAPKGDPNDSSCDFEVDAVSFDEQEMVASKSLRIVMLLLAPRVLSMEAHRKPFVHMISALLEKLDVHEAGLLSTAVKIAGTWLLAPSATSLSHSKQSTKKNSSKRNAVLASKERTTLMAKVALVERFADHHETTTLIKQYRDVVLRVSSLVSQSSPQWVTQQAVQHAFTAGLMTAEVGQRHRYFEHLATRFYSGKGPFARMRLIAKQDWSPLANGFWLPIAISMLLSAVNGSALSETTSETVRMKGVRLGNWKVKSQERDRSSSISANETINVSDAEVGVVSLATLVKADNRFMAELQGLRRSDCLLTPLQELCFGDGSGAVAFEAWREIFKEAWHVLEEQQKMTMTQGLHVLLSRGYHRTHLDTQVELVRRTVQHSSQMIEQLRAAALEASLQSHGRWDPYRSDTCVVGTGDRNRRWRRRRLHSPFNVVQAFLAGIEQCNPMPVIAPELLKHLAENFGCWYIVMRQGEQVLHQLSETETEDDHQSETRSRWAPVLYSLYGSLGLYHDRRGLLKACSVAPPTHVALAYESVGKWNEAKQLYEEAIFRTRTGNGRFAVVDTSISTAHHGTESAHATAPHGPMSPSNQQTLRSPTANTAGMSPYGSGPLLDQGNMPMGGGVGDMNSPVPLLPPPSNSTEYGSGGLLSGVGEQDVLMGGLPPLPLIPLDPYDPMSGLDMDNLFEEFPLDGSDALMLEEELDGSPQGGRTGIPAVDVSELEMSSWESGWVECCRQLNQWEDIMEYGRTCSDARLYLEGAAYSQSPDLRTLRDLFRTHSITAALDQGQLDVALQQLFVGIQEEQRSTSSMGDLEVMWWQTANAYLERCWSVCHSVPGISEQPHHLGVFNLARDTNMMSSFQQLVELDESIKTLGEVPNSVSRYLSATVGGMEHSKRSHIMQQLISRWRKRVPGKHENMLMWNRIMSWRTLFFDVLESTVQTSVASVMEGKGMSEGDSLASITEAKSQELLSSVADRDWTLLCSASAARKLNNVDLCMHFLSRVGTGDVYQDENLAFMRLREELLLCQNQVALDETCSKVSTNTAGSHPSLRTPLAVIGDLEKLLLGGVEGVFKSRHVGELLRLKATTLADTLAPTTVERREVISMITRAARMSVDDSKIWLEWGCFSDRMLQEVEGRAILNQGSGESPESAWKVSDWTDQQEGVLASRIADCFLQGSALGCQQSRLMLSRVLTLLRRENADYDGTNLTPKVSPKKNMVPPGTPTQDAAARASSGTTRESRPVAQSISRHSEVVPTWVWLPWIPQMVTSLNMGELKVARNLLGGLARDYPQIVYYSLRAQLSDAARHARRGAGGQIQQAGGETLLGKRKATEEVSTPISKRQADEIQGTPGSQETVSLTPVGTKSQPVQQTPTDSAATKPALPVSAANTTPLRPDNNTTTQSKIGSPKSAFAPLGAAEELVSYLRRQHPDFGREAEAMLEKIISRLQPSLVEELFTAVFQLYRNTIDLRNRCLGTQSDGVQEANMVYAMLDKTISKYFTQTRNTSAQRELQRRFREPFLADFGEPSTGAPRASVATILLRLNRWKQVLESEVSRSACVESTQMYSRSLAKFQARVAQIPGQYYLTDGFELPRVGDHCLLRNIEPFVKVSIGAGGAVQRRVSFRSYDGTVVNYLVQSSAPLLAHTDQRMMQFTAVLNTLLSREGVAASQGLRLSMPIMVPIAHRVRLQLVDTSTLPLSFPEEQVRAMELRMSESKDSPTSATSLATRGSSDAVNNAMISSVSAALVSAASTGKDQTDALKEARIVAFNEACQAVPAHILRDMVSQDCESHVAFVSTRDQLCRSLGLSSLLVYLTGGSKRSPSKTVLDTRSGEVRDTEIRPMITSAGNLATTSTDGNIESESAGMVVPFRLTRNVQELIGPAGMLGQFPATMRGAATGLLSKQNHAALSAYLLLFLRDELVTWNITSRNSAQHCWYPASLSNSVSSTDHVTAKSIWCNQARKLYRKVEENKEQVISKLLYVSGIGIEEEARKASGVEGTISSTLNPEDNVNTLIEAATDPSRLSLMDPSWEAWF